MSPVEVVKLSDRNWMVVMAMRHAGACTVAQDEERCVVYGMSKGALKLGAVEQSIPPGGIAATIVKVRIH